MFFGSRRASQMMASKGTRYPLTWRVIILIPLPRTLYAVFFHFGAKSQKVKKNNKNRKKTCNGLEHSLRTRFKLVRECPALPICLSSERGKFQDGDAKC